MSLNHGWSEERLQLSKKCKNTYIVKEEVNVLSAKMELLIKKLEEWANFKKDQQAIQQVYDSYITCEVCGNIGHSGNICHEVQQDMSYINNYGPQQGQGKYQVNNNSFNSNQPSLKDLVLEQAKINEDISKKLASNDKILENINNKMNNFSSAIKDQLSYNEILES